MSFSVQKIVKFGPVKYCNSIVINYRSAKYPLTVIVIELCVLDHRNCNTRYSDKLCLVSYSLASVKSVKWLCFELLSE